jgi:hypothetical protein
MEGLRREIQIPCKDPKFSSLKMILERISEPRIKRKGERGSPCLIPREGKNLPKGTPSRRMEKEEVVIHCLIHWIHMGWKPSKDKIFNKNSHSKESKAFSMSSFKAICPPLPFFCFIE